MPTEKIEPELPPLVEEAVRVMEGSYDGLDKWARRDGNALRRQIAAALEERAANVWDAAVDGYRSGEANAKRCRARAAKLRKGE